MASDCILQFGGRFEFDLRFDHLDIASLDEGEINYLKQSKTLSEFCRRVSGETEAQLLALAVYGWMPRVIGSCYIPVGLLLRVRRSEKVDQACSLVKSLKGPPINSSWVGTSKFLHFLNPAVFPIWDSHIARAAKLEGWRKCEKRGAYIRYIEVITAAAAQNNSAIDAAITVVEREYGYKMTRLRALEFLIFSRSREEKRKVAAEAKRQAKTMRSQP